MTNDDQTGTDISPKAPRCQNPLERSEELVSAQSKQKVNKPESEVRQDVPLTTTEILKRVENLADSVNQELLRGLKAISSYPKSVTFFGSARLKDTDDYYKSARSIAGKLCGEGYAVITGGGPGIMEAGNRGSHETCGSAVGFNIELPYEQIINPYVTDEVNFHYFFTRKVSMTFSAEVYMYFPGGFGTLDELFEILPLIQTEKIDQVPVILFGSKFWKPLDEFIRNTLLKDFKTVSESDPDLYVITDSEEEVLEIIKKAPVRRGAYFASQEPNE
jgi:uncharacterized protein (TIGR00730 family)